MRSVAFQIKVKYDSVEISLFFKYIYQNIIMTLWVNFYQSDK